MIEFNKTWFLYIYYNNVTNIHNRINLLLQLRQYIANHPCLPYSKIKLIFNDSSKIFGKS